MNTENVWKSGLQAAKLLSGSRLQIVFFIKKKSRCPKNSWRDIWTKTSRAWGQSFVCCRLSGWCPQKKEGTAAIVVSADGKQGGMEDLSDTDVFGMLQERAHRTDDVRFHLTELGEELLPLCRELERFGRLYEAAKDLVPELMGANDIPWAESDGTAAGSTDAGSPQNTEDDFNNLPAKKASAKDRHGFYQADNAFVFFQSAL